MNQSEFLVISCNLLKVREKPRIKVRLVLVRLHRLKKNCRVFKPATKRSNGNRVITFDSDLKTAVCCCNSITDFPLSNRLLHKIPSLKEIRGLSLTENSSSFYRLQKGF